MERHGRAVDRATVGYVIRGEVEPLYDALTAYANEDGGFGNALEPDVGLADSFTLATTVALQMLAMFGAACENKLVAKAMNYLAGTMKSDVNAWQIVPENLGDSTHAPALVEIQGYRRIHDQPSRRDSRVHVSMARFLRR